MNFNYELTASLKKSKDGQDHHFEIDGWVDKELFVINSVKVYAPAMEDFFDCTEDFKRRQSYVEAVSEMANEDYRDLRLSELMEKD